MCKPKAHGGLGFRYLLAFNKVLLEKQIWRIIHQPHSIVVWVFKAKYFPNESIWEVGEGFNPSFVSKEEKKNT